MAVEFGTVGFYQAMAETLNEDPVWAQKGGHLHYNMVYRYGPPLDRDFWMTFKEGKVLNVHESSAAEAETADFIISGDTDVWRSIFVGELNPTVAMARGKVKIQGKASELVKNMGAFKYVLDAMGKVDFA